MNFDFFFFLVLLLTFAQATNSTTVPDDSSDEDTSSTVILAAVILFCIVFLGFIWLLYENNRKVKIQNKSLDKTERSRASVVSNSFTAIPITSPHNVPLKEGELEFTELANREQSSAISVGGVEQLH